MVHLLLCGRHRGRTEIDRVVTAIRPHLAGDQNDPAAVAGVA
jgi:hypothetical protein